jgi:hypothetical protein
MKSRSATIGMLVFLVVTGAAEALALPDAVLRGLAAGGADLEGGERVPIAVTLANQGNSPLASVPVVLRIDDSPLAEWQPPQTLAPGESAEWVFTWTAVRGSHIILAQVRRGRRCWWGSRAWSSDSSSDCASRADAVDSPLPPDFRGRANPERSEDDPQQVR